MASKERSFRIGCGRYLQGQNKILDCAGDEVVRLGSYPIIVGDDTALEITGEALVDSISKTCEKYEIIIHNGTCNEERAKEIAAIKEEKGCDVVVGVGGGVIMDFAKLCGYFAECPVINIPTSSATCAAYTPLSVRYTPEGRTVGSLHYEYEVDAVIADTTVIARQPVHLLLAGVFDALAKFVEIKQRFSVEENQSDPLQEFPLGLDNAYVLSKYTYALLSNNVAGAVEDMEKGIITHRLENIIFASIATTGVISGIARGSNQCALAHKFYETTRVLFPEAARPYLHGEIVGVGLLLQNYFNGEEDNNKALLELMKKHNMPYRITDVGIDPAKEYFEEYYRILCASSAIDGNNEAERALLRRAMEYLWEM